MDRREFALTCRQSGHNCCQSVLAAFADKMDVSSDILKRIGASFGGGMGNMEGPCGALCGAEMALGLILYKGKPIHAAARRVQSSFVERTGSQICREIKGIGTGRMLCPCEDCIRNAVAALESVLEEGS